MYNKEKSEIFATEYIKNSFGDMTSDDTMLKFTYNELHKAYMDGMLKQSEYVDDIWQVNNKLKITIIEDYLTIDEIIGTVIWHENGYALETNSGSVYKCQGTYWFGKLLNNKIEIIT